MKTSLLSIILIIGLIIPGLTQTKEFHSWAKTPPMGWNSYDCFGATVNEEEFKDNARMLSFHLKDAGWEYVVIDYCWYYPYVGALNNPPQTDDFKPSLPMDEYGRLLPVVDRFPSAGEGNGFKAISDYVHELGLKFGIHVMRGIPREAVARKMPIKGTKITADQIADTNSRCNWLNTMYGIDMSKPGAQEYYNSLFEMYADWGIDFVKVDDISGPYSATEIEAVRKAIDNSGRPIVLSLSPGYRSSEDMSSHVTENANMWRISRDFWDEWEKLKEMFALTHKWEDKIGSGHYPDADMIPIGLLNVRGPHDGLPRRSGFTDTEKYTLMSLWSICRSPLMYGGDLRMMRPIELKLLTNREVLEVNQNSLNNHQLFRREDQVAWIADVPGENAKYLAVFNLGEDDKTPVRIPLSDLGFNGEVSIRDLWKKETIGVFRGEFTPLIGAHAGKLYKLSEN